MPNQNTVESVYDSHYLYFLFIDLFNHQLFCFHYIKFMFFKLFYNSRLNKSCLPELAAGSQTSVTFSRFWANFCWWSAFSARQKVTAGQFETLQIFLRCRIPKQNCYRVCFLIFKCRYIISYQSQILTYKFLIINSQI